MTQTPGAGQRRGQRDDHCYRHPQRVSFVLCQRCGRTVCPECQTQAPVGVICPDCLRSDRRRAPRPSRGATSRSALTRATRSMTLILIIVTGAVSLLQLLIAFASGRDPIGDALLFQGVYAHRGGPIEPWRELTYALVHGSFLHLAFNLVALWFFGSAIEAVVGRWRLLLLYATGVLAGAAAVALLAPTSAVIGASGGVFALMAASFFVLRQQRASTRTLVVLIGLNLAFGFFASGVSWQAHVGGLAVGALAGWLLVRDASSRGPRRGPRLGTIVTAALAIICAAAPFAASALLPVGTGF